MADLSGSGFLLLVDLSGSGGDHLLAVWSGADLLLLVWNRSWSRSLAVALSPSVQFPLYLHDLIVRTAVALAQLSSVQLRQSREEVVLVIQWLLRVYISPGNRWCDVGFIEKSMVGVE